MRDLALRIDENLGRRAGLERALRDAVRSGRLPAGSTLPSSRALALDLGYARATVVAAYEQLSAEGYLATRAGVGTVVAELRVPQPEAPPTPEGRPRLLADFRPGEPDTSSFPRQRWLRSARRALATATDESLGYPDPRGLPVLRVALAEYLARTRAVEVGPNAVSIFGGFAASIAMLGEVFRGLGIDEVAVEDPTLFIVRDLLELAGVRPVPIPVDDEGLRVDLLEATGARAVVVTPAHQYPLGVLMSAERRNALVDWAHANDGWIVEDDYDGEFRYGGRPIGALQGLDPDRVIYAGTASKSLIPGLRLSWLVVPRPLRRDLARVKHLRGLTSVLDQLTLADFITSGDLDRHLRSSRATYRARRRALVDALSPIVPLASDAAESAGLHVTVRLPATVDDERLVHLAADHAIGLLSLSSHVAGGGAAADAGVDLGPGLVLGFSRPPGHAFATGLDDLAKFLRTNL